MRGVAIGDKQLIHTQVALVVNDPVIADQLFGMSGNGAAQEQGGQQEPGGTTHGGPILCRRGHCEAGCSAAMRVRNLATPAWEGQLAQLY
ncbi:hypothetical protein thsps21_01260 [Pseudomonas sp. No.21]|nr:hypothetical protein TUM20249_24420 [Pseudomonas tohonis]